MRRTFFTWLLLVVYNPLLWADQPSFSVEIVGAAQAATSSEYDYTGQEYAVIEFPKSPVSSGNTVGEFEPKSLKPSIEFYIVLRNTSKKPIKLWILISDLYNSLSFDFTLPNGKLLHIDRHQRSWDKNFPVPWYFAPGASRVICVDFVNYPWDGLPGNLPIDSVGLSKMKARFTYFQQPELKLGELFDQTIKSQKPVPRPDPIRYSFESDETKVITQVGD